MPRDCTALPILFDIGVSMMYSPSSARKDPVLSTRTNCELKLCSLAADLTMKKQQTKQQQQQKQKSAKAGPVKSAPVAYSQKQSFPKQGDNMRRRRIKNSELVKSIDGSVSFSASRLQLNPGLVGTFPWLSQTAANWQQYCFHRLEFRYVTRTSTSEKGSIILSPDYNPRDPAPISEQQASNTMDAVENVIWENITCKLDPGAMHPIGNRKIIRRSNVPGDLNLYDVGNLFICTVGEDSADEIGKLWVDYDVELFAPQNSPNTDTTSTSISMYGLPSDQTLVNNTNTKVEFDIPVVDGLSFGTIVDGSFTPPAGTYMVTCIAQFASTDGVDTVFELSLQLAGDTVITQSIHFPVIAANNVAAPLMFQYPVSVDGTQSVNVFAKITASSGTRTIESSGSYVSFTAI